MPQPNPPPRGFNTTRWSLVRQAGGGDSAEKTAALSQLCRDYWYPVYAFVRRYGNDHHDAQDLTQGFFAQVLERDSFGSADPQKGRFRSYLLTAAKNHMTKQHRSDSAKRRGGDTTVISIDDAGFEERFLGESTERDTPEVIYNRSWATTLLAKVLETLGAEYERAGKAELFAGLREKLTDTGGTSNEAVGAALGMSKGAVAVALHRMRGRYRELLRREVRETLGEGETDMDVDEEIHQLLAVVK